MSIIVAESFRMKLATAAQMRLCDKKTIEGFGISGIDLMENAGRGTVKAMLQHYGDFQGQEISVIVGPGNNGGDGLVIARLLYELGAVCHIFLLIHPEKFQGDAAVNLARIHSIPLPIHHVLGRDDVESMTPFLLRSRLIVDAIFGTGLTREVTGHFAQVIQYIKEAGRPVVAVDIPSGLCSDSGMPLGIAIEADMTATFGLVKIGQVVHPGVQHVGKLEVIDIGIPPSVISNSGIQAELLVRETLSSWLPERNPESHKGTFGHLLIAAGSIGKSGAAILCGQGALRSGVGLVTLCAPKCLNLIFETSLIEAMSLPLPNSDTCFLGKDCEFIAHEAEKRSVLVLGPGLGTEEETADLVVSLYRKLKVPMVIDADGLNLLARNLNFLKNPPGPRILTPHPGEMSRLCGKSTKDIQQNRWQMAADFAAQFKLTLVLKGASTVVAGPDGNVAVNPTGNTGMAAGGMGDVLTGLIGGLLAQGLTPWQSACLGVFVHGLAGDRLAGEKKISFGYLASELAMELPSAFRSLKEES